MSATGHASVAVPTPASPSVAIPGDSRGRTSLISVSRFGDAGDGDSYGPSLSADGRFVAFVSGSDNLVPGDTNGRDDVFVRDTKTGTTSRINVSNTGAQGNGIRILPPSVSIDGDGRYVAFQTDDTNLVPGAATTCVISAPGSQPCPGIFVRDLRAGTTRQVNESDSGVPANGHSQFPAISSNGRYVAFVSGASDLVPADTNRATDVFVADLTTSTIRRVSISSTGVQADADSYYLAISANGRYIAFDSAATTLAPGKPSKKVIGIYLRDLQAGTTQLVGIYGVPPEDFFGSVAMSPNGRYIAFESLSVHGIVVRDMQTGSVQRLSVLTGAVGPGFAEDPVFDATGRHVAFTFQQVRVRDLVARATSVVSVSGTGSQSDGGEPAISGDGRFVAFSSRSPNLSKEGVLPGTEIFLRGPLN